MAGTVDSMDTPDITRSEVVKRVVALTGISLLLLIGIESVGNRVLAAVGRWNLVIVLGALVTCFVLGRGTRGHAEPADRSSEPSPGVHKELHQ